MLLNFVKLVVLQLSGVEISWVRIFLVEIFRVGIVLGGNFLVGNCPGGSYPGSEFSLMGVFRVRIVRWESSGRQFAGWQFLYYPKTYWNILKTKY